MEMRAIGSIPVPLSGIGCNNFGRRIDEERSREVIDGAFEVGATLFDTADLYGDTASEEFLGRALKGAVGILMVEGPENPSVFQPVP